MAPPTEIVDCHHHFLAPDQPFHATLGKIGAPTYTAAQYTQDCGTLNITKSVHVEALADDGIGETNFVDALASSGACKVAAIKSGNPYNHGHDVDWTYTLVRPVEATKGP